MRIPRKFRKIGGGVCDGRLTEYQNALNINKIKFMVSGVGRSGDRERSKTKHTQKKPTNEQKSRDFEC